MILQYTPILKSEEEQKQQDTKTVVFFKNSKRWQKREYKMNILKSCESFKV